MSTGMTSVLLWIFSLSAIDVGDLPGTPDLWTREYPGAKRRFDAVADCAEIAGNAATRDTWETEGYEGTYDSLRNTWGYNMHRSLARHMNESFLPSLQEVRESIVLVPARLRGERDTRDMVYCLLKRDGREILLSLHAGGLRPFLGVKVSLLPSEQALIEEDAGLAEFQKVADALVHSILKEDKYAPYRIEVVKEGERLVFRGKHALPVQEQLVDTDDHPIHYRSTIAGYVLDAHVVIAWDELVFYYDWESRECLNFDWRSGFSYSDKVFDDCVQGRGSKR